MKKVFPACYPTNLLKLIKEDGAQELKMENVYRIGINGCNNRDSYLSTFLESRGVDDVEYNIRDCAVAINLDIGDYSTSLNYIENQIRKLIKVMEKHHDGPVLLKGTITPDYGLSMRTCDSKNHRKSMKGHIDWWLYEGADPSANFDIII